MRAFPGRLTLAILTLASATPAVFAQAEGESPADQPYNYSHPPGTQTAPLGALGHVEKRGRGAMAMILLPGASFGGSVWDGFMERNADRYTMYAITPAGYGGTPPPPMPEEVENFTDPVWTNALLDGVVDLVKREGLDRPIVVGHHLMGDHYALRLGLEHPDLFRGVVVVSGAPTRIMVPQQSNPSTPEAAHAALMTPVEAQRAAVEEQWIPFFRTVTRERWLQGTYKGNAFALDADRGKALYEEQIATPIPTQLRYFMEYLMTNIAPRLSSLKIPLLVVDPQRDPENIIEQAVEMQKAQAGSEEAARERVMQFIDQRYGSYEEFAKQISKNLLWEALRGDIPQFQLEYVPNSRIFIMDDQPAALDQLVAKFADGLSGKGS